eukprot:jgi/Orpsp1_1/1178385/evm.model.c7180000065066.1
MFNVTQYDYGFLKKFKSLSEYRILIAAFVTIVFLPIASIASILRIYFKVAKGMDLEFQFENLRQTIANVQYYMIFIDQILLIISNYESTLSSYGLFNSHSYPGSSYNNNNTTNNNINNISKHSRHHSNSNTENISKKGSVHIYKNNS